MARKQNNDNQEVLVVTAAGLAEMQAELKDRLQKSKDIAYDIDEARKLGDLKENEPYADAMQRKEMNDARVDELNYLVSIAQVVEGSAEDIVSIGTQAEIQNLQTKAKKMVTLVGKAARESDPTSGKISIDSPLGKAINGIRVGGEFEVSLPAGIAKYKILRIA